jgi:tRNA-specific 2-thiouridylase
MKLFNFSLNTMSLMGLSLAVGLLVDDAIVVIENITRHMHLGKSPLQAAKEGTKEIGLAVHNKKDSEEICFITDTNHGRYISEAKPDRVKPGNFVDKNGNVLGQHKGIVYYTIGQRKGLGLSLGRPVFVIGINAKTNEVVLGAEDDIFKTDLVAMDVNFIPFDKLEKEIEVTAKIRYSAKPAAATLTPLPNGRVKVSFKEKQRAITKGQSVVFYDNEIVVGGGIIETVL